MARSANIKSPTVTSTVTMNNSNTLTVIVLDAKSQPVPGAKVSIEPSNASGVTNNAGEIQFTLGNAIKYDVTASVGSNTVTVPYYVTKNGATRLIINPAYVKSVETQLNHSQSSSVNLGFLSIAGIVLGIVIVLVIIWRLFRRRRRT